MNPAVSLIDHPCMVCFKSTSMWCSRCQKVWYCSPEHLQSDWPRHRLECVPIASACSNVHAAPQPVQPRLITVSAILFAYEEDRPRVIAVNCEPPSTPAQGTCPTPLVHGYFPEGQADSVVLTQGLNGEPLRFPLHLWYSPGALAANAPINQAITRITSGFASKPWCGPVIVLKYNGSMRQGYSDPGPNDMPALSETFYAGPHSSMCIPLQVPPVPGHGHREDIPPPVEGVAGPSSVQDPHGINVAYQGTVDYRSQSLPNPAYMFPDAGHAQGIPIQVQPDAPVDQEHNPFGYVPPHDAPGLVQDVFPDLFVQRIPTPDPPPQAGTENLRRLACHYLHHPDAHVSMVTMESGTGGRIKVAVIFETPDF